MEKGRPREVGTYAPRSCLAGANDHSSRRAAERSAAGGVSSSSVALLPDGSTHVEAIEKITTAAKKEVRRKTRKAKKAARKAPNSAAATTQKEASRIYLPTSLLPAKPRRKATQKKAAAVPGVLTRESAGINFSWT